MRRSQRIDTLQDAARLLAKVQGKLLDIEETSLARSVGNLEIKVHERAIRIARAPRPPKKKKR